MRIAGHSNKLETNQTISDSQSFGIGDPSVVIEILRNRLYEHKIRTLVQEYMSNARDAHREIKQIRTIEVVAPTQLEPTFKVRDFGPGITPDRMANVFVLYGASTKRTSNNQTGGFGIGAKSAWSYADGFIVVSTTDGVRRTYHAHVGSSNVGQLDCIEIVNSDEPNGCEIQVAVKPRDVYEFQESIKRACYFWNKDEMPTVKNLSMPSAFQGYELGALTVITNGALPGFVQNYNDATLVVDGIPYVLTDELMEKVQQLRDLNSALNGQMVIRIPNGIVQVSASREKLDDSDFTRKGLAKIGTKLLTDVKKHLADKVGAIKSVKDFVQTYHSMYRYFVMETSEYEGFKFDGKYLTAPLLASIRLARFTKQSRNSLRETTEHGIPFEHLENIYLVSKTEPKVTTNRRIREFLNTNRELYIIQERQTTVTATNGSTSQLQLPIAPAKALADLQKVLIKFKDFHSLPFTVPPRNPRAAKTAKLATQQTFHRLNGYGRITFFDSAQNLSASGKTYVYLLVSDWTKNRSKYNDIIQEFKAEQHDAKAKGPFFVAVSQETAAIIEGETGFIKYADWYKTITLDNDIRLRMMYQKRLNHEVVNKLSQLDTLENKFLTKMVAQYKIFNKVAGEVCKELVDMFKDDKEYQKFLKDDADLRALIDDKFPLLKHVEVYKSTELKKELVWYLNNK